MTLEEWAAHIDALLAQRTPQIEAHVESLSIYETLYDLGVRGITRDNPAWRHGGRWVSARVSEDDSSLRLMFIPRNEADEAYPDVEHSHEKLYFRSDAGAREAAIDIARFFLSSGE